METKKINAFTARSIGEIDNSQDEDGIVRSLLAWKDYTSTMEQEVRLSALELFYDLVRHSYHWSPSYKKLCFTFLAKTRLEWKNIQPAAN